MAASAQRRREQVLDAGFQGRDFRKRDFGDEIKLEEIASSTFGLVPPIEPGFTEPVS